MGDQLALSNNKNFNIISSTGQCLSSSGTASQFKLQFGMNLRLSCNCPSCTGLLPIFTSFMGKTVPRYSGDTNSSNTLTTPSVSDQTMTTLQLNFIIGTYGSQNFRYIERITSSYTISSTSERGVNIVFVMPEQIKTNTGAPSFFPQIPKDMFYPVYLVS